MSRPFSKESFDLKWKAGSSGCWEWQRVKNQDGYGRVKRNGKLESAHRVAYELYVGPIGDKQVLHKCDNPGCVNPDHLFLGTIQDNNRDKAQKGRARTIPMPGESHPKHKLTEQQVRDIRNSTLSQSKLGSLYSVSQQLISRVKSGSVWRHIEPT
jgi:hypothetical protein